MAKGKDNASETLQALLVAQSIRGADDPEVKELLNYFLAEQTAKIREAKERLENHRREALAQAREGMERRARIRANCSHKKPYPSVATRLAGQHLGNGQTLLVCSRCHSEFFLPAKKGQTAPPSHLLPNPDFVGGPMSFASALA